MYAGRAWHCGVPLELQGSFAHFGAMSNPLDKQEGGDWYKKMKIQPVEYAQANHLGYCEASVVKYVSRHKLRGGKEDLLKAIHFLELLIQLEYNQKSEYMNIMEMADKPRKCYVCNRDICASENAIVTISGLICVSCEAKLQRAQP